MTEELKKQILDLIKENLSVRVKVDHKSYSKSLDVELYFGDDKISSDYVSISEIKDDF